MFKAALYECFILTTFEFQMFHTYFFKMRLKFLFMTGSNIQFEMVPKLKKSNTI